MKLFSNLARRITCANRNRVVLECMRQEGFEAPAIRLALVKANRIKYTAICRNGLHPAAISQAVHGKVYNREAVALIAAALDLGVAELFPELPPHRQAGA